MMTPELIVPINAQAVTFTSQPFNIENAKAVTFLLTRAGHSAGSSTFTLEVSLDGITYVAYNKLISNVANTNVQDLTRVASVALASNTSSVVSMDLVNDIYRWARLISTIATDGNSTVKALISRQY